MIDYILSLVNSKLEIQIEDSIKELVMMINSQSKECVTNLNIKIKAAEKFTKVNEKLINNLIINDVAKRPFYECKNRQ